MNSNIKNPNSFINRMKKSLKQRWSASDGGISEVKFQTSLLLKDLGIFLALPITTVVLFKMIENASLTKKPNRSMNSYRSADSNLKIDSSRSQIIEFKKSGLSGQSTYGRKTAGTLVKVKLLNVVETYSNAPVYVQVMDISLGGEWVGSTLIGEASPDSSIDRANINFHLAKSLKPGVAYPMKGRALSLNGTLGIEAEKKEGFFARSALNSSDSIGSGNQESDNNLKNFLITALASGLLREASSNGNVSRNRSQVLTLKPGEVFFVELTDNFPTKQ